MPEDSAEVPVYLDGQDLDAAPAFTAPRDWCRIKRAAGKGKFVKHSRAFRLIGSAPSRPGTLTPPGPHVRGQSAMVGKSVMDAFVDPGETPPEKRKHKAARAIVRGWKPSVALARHRASLARRSGAGVI